MATECLNILGTWTNSQRRTRLLIHQYYTSALRKQAVSNFDICLKPKESQWKYFPETPGKNAGQCILLRSESMGLGSGGSGFETQVLH